MDFLDPKKVKRHTILLYCGYALIGIAIVISTIVLIYQANGFGVNSKGQLVQNGLVFYSSHPNPADIYLNDQKNNSQTNTRLSVPAGSYNVRLVREGYHDWRHPLNVVGADVQHFDYPFLFPEELDTENRATYQEAHGIATQSRDRRWLVVQQSPTATKFDVYDLDNPDEAAEAVTLPAGIATLGGAEQRWEVVQWANDNQYVLLKHSNATASEYIVLHRTDPDKALNLNKALSTNPVELTLIDNKYDQYHLFDPASGVLSRATLDQPEATELLEGVLEYKAYGTKTLVYVTRKDALEGKARVMMQVGDKNYPVRDVAADTTYLLDMAGYRGAPYVVLSASSENIMYVYRDPVAQLGDDDLDMPDALRAIKITSPTYLSFSPNAQYVVAQGGTQFALYDIFLKRAHSYTHDAPLDAPQQHAEWMDGNRLTYVSGGKLVVFDYDHRNPHTLMSATAGAAPFFSPDYNEVYAFAPGTAGAASQLTLTHLLVEADR